MEACRPRLLVFEDSSESLPRNPLLNAGPDGEAVSTQIVKQEHLREGADMTGDMGDLGVHLARINSDLQDSWKVVEQRVDDLRKEAVDQQETTGGRKALENHLQAQKGNWKFAGQKEAFLQQLSSLTHIHDLLRYDFTRDMEQAQAAYSHYKDVLKQRQMLLNEKQKATNDSIRQLVRSYEEHSGLATQLARQLPRVETEFKEYAASRLQVPEPTAGGITGADLSRALAEEDAFAEQEETDLARVHSHGEERQADCAALEASLALLQEELAALDEEIDQAAQQEGARYINQLQSVESEISTVSHLSGVELSNSDHTTVHVTIVQTIPRGMPCRLDGGIGTSKAPQAAAGGATDTDGGAGTVVAEHLLILEFESPSSQHLISASLNPAAVDISQDVAAALARQVQGAFALDDLVYDVKARIRRHCCRQMQLDDAHDLYPLHATDVSPEVLRCALPNKVEVEVLVPVAWPVNPNTRVQLVTLQPPDTSVDLSPLMARLQQELEGKGSGGGKLAEARRRELQGAGLRQVLTWVYNSVVVEMQRLNQDDRSNI